MTVVNVLMLGGWVDHAFTFVRSFARQPQVRLFVADPWPNSACGYSRHCTRFHRIPRYEDPEYIPAVLEVCRQERIDVLLPVHQEDLVEVARSQESFEQAGIRLPIPPVASIEMAVDKYRMAQFAEKAGLRAPATYLLSEIGSGEIGRAAQSEAPALPGGPTPAESRRSPERGIAYPVLIKLRSSTGQRGQKRIDSPEAFDAHTAALLTQYPADEIIVQEFIPGRELGTMWTVGLLYNHRHRLRACVPLRKIRSRPYTGGTAICTVAEDRADVRELALGIMAAFDDWQGIADVEIKIDPQGRPAFIELNPRPWGSMYGTYVAGVDFPLLWLQVAQREDFAPVETFREGLYGSFLSRDLALLRDLLGKLRTEERAEAWTVIKTYAHPYLHRNRNSGLPVTSDFVLDDLKPFRKNLKRFL